MICAVAKSPDAQVFETMNAGDLNTALKERMEGLSVKVFRTYNASITLDRLLYKDSVSQTLEEKKADYDRANKEVRLRCNEMRPMRGSQSLLSFPLRGTAPGIKSLHQGRCINRLL